MILSKRVEQAIELLRNAPYKCVVGKHDTTQCPIATGYKVDANYPWSKVSVEDRRTLSKAGWTPIVYNGFIDWYDGSVSHGVMPDNGNVYRELRNRLRKVERRIDHRRRRQRVAAQ